MQLANSIRSQIHALGRRAYTSLRALADRRLSSRAQRLGHKSRPRHLVIGERGEDAAFFYLRDLGYTVVARRWRAQRLPGDLDLVAWDGDTLVLFEVKTRTAHDLAPAETQVDEGKRRMLRRMASAYLGQFPEPYRASIPLRFDILSVYFGPAGATFEHFPNAFSRANPAARNW